MCNFAPHYFLELEPNDFKYFCRKNTIRIQNAHKLFYEYTKKLTIVEKTKVLKGISQILNDQIDEYSNIEKLWEIFCCASEVLKFKAKNTYKCNISEKIYEQIKTSYLIDFKLNDIEKLLQLSECIKISESGIDYLNKYQNLFIVKNVFFKKKQTKNNYDKKELFLICYIPKDAQDTPKEIFCIKYNHLGRWKELATLYRYYDKPYATIKIIDSNLVCDIVTKSNNHINTHKLLSDSHKNKDKLQDFQTYFSVLQKDELDMFINSYKNIQEIED